TLAAAWGPQHWWPAQSRFEVIVGAFLTQNTAWTNVEYAMRNLRRARVLSVDGIRRTALAELEQLVRPSGYFRQKGARAAPVQRAQCGGCRPRSRHVRVADCAWRTRRWSTPCSASGTRRR